MINLLNAFEGGWIIFVIFGAFIMYPLFRVVWNLGTYLKNKSKSNKKDKDE